MEPLDFAHTLFHSSSAADSVAWMDRWGGRYLLFAAALMALALGRELWPLARLHLRARNRMSKGRCLIDGVVLRRLTGMPGEPVEIVIHQEYRKISVPSTTGRMVDFGRWFERSRDVRVEPFDVRLGDDRVVRVSPTDNRVTLVRALGGHAGCRQARIQPGDRVLVDGEITGRRPVTAANPYRDGEDEGVPRLLRPWRRRPLWIAFEPEARRIMRRASGFYAVLMVALIGCYVAIQYGADDLKQLREFARRGQVVTFEVNYVQHRPGQEDWLTAETPQGGWVFSECHIDVCAKLSRGDKVPWTYLPENPSFNALGVREHGLPQSSIAVYLIWGAWLLALWVYFRSYRPWYRRAKVNQRDCWM
jgi:hypothetical protein